MKKDILLIGILLVCICNISWAIAPPRPGVKVPAFLLEEFKQIRSEYGTGYWALEMERRRVLRESLGGEFVTATAGVDTIRMPVLLGRYSNSSATYSRQTVQNRLFDNNPTGTITQFYTENSYGKMYLTGAVSDWGVAPQLQSYYAANGGRDNSGRRDFVIDLIINLDPTFDFSPFVDLKTAPDAEGYHVKLLAVVHTGAGAEAGAPNIWSHSWNIGARLTARKAIAGDTLYNSPRVLSNGHYITNDTYNGLPVIIDGAYTTMPEMGGGSDAGGPLIQIGVFCHEFGHALGLPDQYNTTTGTTDEGLGGWCLMSSGSWGGDQAHTEYPSHMCPWCKIRMGWLTPTIVNSFMPSQPIPKIETSPIVYKVWTLGQTSNEYFLVENRQKIGFDVSILRAGLLIYHVDDAMSNNNDANHHRVDLEQADGLRGINIGSNRGDVGDPFPGSTGNRRFDGYTNPNSKSYNNGTAQTYVGVRNISAVEADTMYADLDVGARPFLRTLAVAQSDAGQASVNGRIEPGESGKLNIQVDNIHPTGATNAEVRIIGSAVGMTVDTSAITQFNLASLATGQVLTSNTISLAQNFIPREIKFNIELKASNFLERYPISVNLGYPSIALMDGDSIAQTSVLYARAAMDSLGRYYEVVRTRDSVSSDAALSKRGTLVYLSGNKKFETIKSAVLDSLNQFLQKGGRVIVSGQNIAEDFSQRGLTTLRDVFHVNWASNFAIFKTLWGVVTDPLGATIGKVNFSGGDGASNQTSPDVLTTDGTGVPFLTYGSAVGGTSVADMRYENPVNKSRYVFLGFGLEAVNNLTSTTSRAAFLQNILNWFDSPTDVSTQTTELPKKFALAPAYPNPFNPSAQIVFEIPRRAQVEIALYNILGQKVRTLFFSVVAAGEHRVMVEGAGLSSGMYICKMNTEGFSASQKLVLLK